MLTLPRAFLKKPRTVEALGPDVCDVVPSYDTPKLQEMIIHLLLHPQVLAIKVPNLSITLSLSPRSQIRPPPPSGCGEFCDPRRSDHRPAMNTFRKPASSVGRWCEGAIADTADVRTRVSSPHMWRRRGSSRTYWLASNIFPQWLAVYILGSFANGVFSTLSLAIGTDSSATAVRGCVSTSLDVAQLSATSESTCNVGCAPSLGSGSNANQSHLVPLERTCSFTEGILINPMQANSCYT